MYPNEDLLHFVWQFQRFNHKDLRTSTGDKLQIIKWGTPNMDAGPDFLQAQIKIDDTLWVGNVEMHIRSSDWIQHNHQIDPAYDNVILHVVLEEDQAISRMSGSLIPCLVLLKRIPPRLFKLYHKLKQNSHWIPCAPNFNQSSTVVKNLWLERLLIERLAQKTERIQQKLLLNKSDWEATFFQQLARGFGGNINGDPMEQLARSLSLNTLLRHRSNRIQLEALLFGQAGLLEGSFEDAYPIQLQKEFNFLKKKYQLTPMQASVWKFLRMRPANFPTIRIAQLATLLHQSNHLFSKILVVENVEQITHMFDVKLSNYWHDHYRFDKISVKRPKKLGKAAIHHLLINTIAPFLFHYGKSRAQEQYQERALALLAEAPPETNNIIKKWKEFGQEADCAGQTQALLQLKKHYCDSKRCLACAIGTTILK